MKIGLRDIRHLAIIGAAGAAGVAATLVVVNAAERPHVRHQVITVDRAPTVHFRSSVRVFRPERPLNEDAAGIRLRWFEPRSAESMGPIVYIDGMLVHPKLSHPLPESATGLDDLNPEDIAKIDVVKGDKALEFGTEAKERGVILVTTKKGKKGSGEEAEKGR